MTNHKINGEVTVERYIGTGTLHAKSWQLLAVPAAGSNPGVNGQTIKDAWQEGATVSNINSTPGSPGNPHPGYGTMMTSNVSSAVSKGFDVYTAPGPSIEVYDHSSNTFVGPPSTTIPLYNKKGYMILVRGDRSVFTYNAPAVPTVLRTKGYLFTPDNPPPSSTVLTAPEFESVGNPYASAIDLRKIAATPGAPQFFIVWDPQLAGYYGLGQYQTLAQTHVLGLYR